MADKARWGDFAPSSGRWMSTLKDALDKTWNILTNSPNRAAVAVLVSALKSRHIEIRLGAIRGLVLRRSAEGHTEIIRRFASFSEMDQAALAEALRIRPSHEIGACTTPCSTNRSISAKTPATSFCSARSTTRCRLWSRPPRIATTAIPTKRRRRWFSWPACCIRKSPASRTSGRATRSLCVDRC